MHPIPTHPGRVLAFLASLVVLASVGCNHTSEPPPPLAIEQIPTAFQKAFDQSGPEPKQAAGLVTSALAIKDYPTAYQEVQALCELPGQTREQRLLATRALLAIMRRVQDERARGDSNAATVLKLRQTGR
jgi:hypothetical protein